MNAETRHQLYGGEISDYSAKPKDALVFDNGIDSSTAEDLANIYNTQIKGKPSINTTGIVSLNPSSLIMRDPQHDKLSNDLNNTLSMIAQQLNLNAQPQTTVSKTTTLLPQTDEDIAAANNNVLQAMQELKDLKAI